MEATIDALVACQECGHTLCKAVDEAHRHTNIDGLPGVLGQFRDCWDRKKQSLSQLIMLLLNDRLVLSWWSCWLNVMIGQSLVLSVSDLTVFTNVLLKGSDSATGSDKWPLQWRSFAINWLELEAIRFALVAFQPQVVNRTNTSW